MYTRRRDIERSSEGRRWEEERGKPKQGSHVHQRSTESYHLDPAHLMFESWENNTFPVPLISGVTC